jgi:hypothetical protein
MAGSRPSKPFGAEPQNFRFAPVSGIPTVQPKLVSARSLILAPCLLWVWHAGPKKVTAILDASEAHFLLDANGEQLHT